MMETPEGYLAAVEGAAVFDRSERGKIAVAGSDRRSYLHAMLTNDIASLAAGTGCYAAYLTPQGRLIADMRVLELGDLVLLDLDPGVVEGVLQKLDQFVFSEDVRLGDLTQAFARLSVAGPGAARTVAAALDAHASPGERELGSWAEFGNARAAFQGEMVLAAASRELGVPGFDLYVERPRAQALAEALLAGGAQPGTQAAFDALRIETGRPAFPADMDAETIPLEAGIEGRAISFTKGCYPGQEVIVRVVHRGQGRVARKIAGLRVSGAVPSAGDRVKAGDREAGKVTSAAWSPRARVPIALAMLHRDFQAPGTALTIQHGDTQLSAEIVPVPFVEGVV